MGQFLQDFDLTQCGPIDAVLRFDPGSQFDLFDGYYVIDFSVTGFVHGGKLPLSQELDLQVAGHSVRHRVSRDSIIVTQLYLMEKPVTGSDVRLQHEKTCEQHISEYE